MSTVKLSLKATGVGLFHCWTIEINKRGWLRLRYSDLQQSHFDDRLDYFSSSSGILVGTVRELEGRIEILDSVSTYLPTYLPAFLSAPLLKPSPLQLLAFDSQRHLIASLLFIW